MSSFSFTMDHVGSCNSTWCWSAGFTQKTTLSTAGNAAPFVEFLEQDGDGIATTLAAQLGANGSETGTLTIFSPQGSDQVSTLAYKAILDHHVVVPNGGWTGFMAGVITGGTGAYVGALGVVTFTARQLPDNNDDRCKLFPVCYVKFVSVQGYR